MLFRSPYSTILVMTIQHVLFPFDSTKQCQLAIPFVREVVRCFEANLSLLTVTSPFHSEDELPPDPFPKLDQVLSAEFPGVSSTAVALPGEPGPRILKYAQENGVDFIMMPTRGYDAVHSFILGSVTAKVLHDAKCPVWTATYAEERQAASTPRTILCAVDGGERTTELLQSAAQFARKMSAEMKVLHVTSKISDASLLPSEKSLQEEMNQRARDRVAGLMKAAGVEAPLGVATGSITDTVAAVAVQTGADVVIIGRGAAQSTFGRLRTHAYGIISQAPCPVLSL